MNEWMKHLLPKSEVLHREHVKTQTTTDTSNHTGQHTITWNNMDGITVSKFFYPTNTTCKIVDTPSYYLNQIGYVITSIYPSLCLFIVNKITLKVLNGFKWNFQQILMG